MTTAYTSLLGLALPVTGELSGTWGDTVNNSITSLLDTSVAGTTNVSTDADVTLTTTTGASNTARQAILLFSGARTVLRTVTAPAQSKIYTVINATTGGFSVKLVGAGPTTGVTIVAGESAICAWNGSDFVKVSNTGGAASFTNVTVTGTTTLSNLTASTALALDASKNVVSVTNTGSGSNVLATSPTLVTPALGTPSALVGTNITGTATSFNINGTVGATTPAAGAFTTLSATGVTTVQAGTLSLPAITTSGDTNTGIFFPAADTIAATVGGTEGMRLTSTGLGIGTSSPSAKLDVAGNVQIQSTGVLYLNNSDNTNQYYWQNIGATGANNATLILSRTNAGETLRVDSSGNVGIGTTSPSQKLDVAGNITATAWIGRANGSAPSADCAIYRAADNTLGFSTASTERARIDSSGNLFLGATSAAFSEKLRMSGNYAVFENGTYTGFIGSGSSLGTGTGSDFAIRSSNALAFLTGGATERARIDSSGNLLLGTTSQVSSAILSLDGGASRNAMGVTVASGQTGAIFSGTSAYNYNAAVFNYNTGTQVGYIQVQAAATVYSTSSDYRLKNSIAPMTGALAKVALLKPCTYKWNADGSDGEGFIAHELAEVVPQCVLGEKDEVDENGNPKYQGIDTSFLVATLTAAIQEQQAIIESLKARLDAANL